jgi:hypothetical protein
LLLYIKGPYKLSGAELWACFFDKAHFSYHHHEKETKWARRWIVMDPEIFILSEEIAELVETLAELKRLKPDALDHALKLTDMDIRALTFPQDPVDYAEEVAEARKTYEVTDERPDYHPLVSVIEYLLSVRSWTDNLQALKVCKAVGRIKDPLLEKGIGTAVLTGLNRILTCQHVFQRLEEASVCFGYKSSRDKKSYENCLSLGISSKITSSHTELDFAIVPFDGQLDYEFAQFNSEKPRVGEDVRIIHHSQGGPLEISSLGKISKVENGQLHHMINNVGPGASGAPIFNTKWEVIGLHQGPFRGITLNAIHNEIVTLKSSGEKIQERGDLHVNAIGTLEEQSFVELVESWLKEREISSISDNTKQAPNAIELDFLSYGLVSEINKFQRALIPAQGAFAFEIHGDSKLIENYVIEKILRELQHKIGGRTYNKKEINLYAEDLERPKEEGTPSGSEVIERRIKAEKQVDGLVVFLADVPKSQDIVFIIWCKSPLSQQTKSIAQSFWSNAEAKVWPNLVNRGRRIIVIWVTPDIRKRESIGKPFTAISLSEKLDLDDLSNWFWGQLQIHIDKKEIEEETVKAYIESLEKHYGYLMETYTRLEEIAQELANRSFGRS